MILPSLAALWRGAMVVIGIAAVVPASAGDVRSHPSPARGYTDAVFRARARIAADSLVAAPGGESILLTHGARAPRAIVLLHGFTDSPKQFQALADSLYARGDNVFVPRLPHHAERGRDVGELARLTAAELSRAADAAVDVGAGLGDSLVVMGLSVGGTLAVWAAEHRPEVRRAVVIAPPFEVAHVPSMLERAIVNLSSHIPNVTRRAAPDSERPDRDPGFATHALAQVLRLGMAVRRDAEHLAPAGAEVLFLVNANDRTVKTAPVLDLARLWNARSVPVVVYEFPDSLELPHNIVDPMQRRGNDAAVYPTLEALAHGDHPPRWISTRE
ncbi:MAG TPA: alpha/beta fold hydrolase [Gemmatimonadaceae bacterium]|nr:alpha/beta fold hydrolase [Gemmatimonadaceae bacterium]